MKTGMTIVTVKAATRSYGGKGTMITQLLKYFPDPGLYDTFVDAYGGAGTVLLNKPYTQVEIFNDLNRNIFTLMTVLTDSALFFEFKRLTELALFDEPTSEEYRRSLRDGDLDVVTRAFRYWYVARTRRGGGEGGFFVNTVVRRRMSKSTSDFLSSVEGLRELHERLSSVIVRSCDAVKLIGEFDRPRTLIYCFPPGQLVRMSDESQKPIEDVRTGDRIFGEKMSGGCFLGIMSEILLTFALKDCPMQSGLQAITPF